MTERRNTLPNLIMDLSLALFCLWRNYVSAGVVEETENACLFMLRNYSISKPR